MRLDAYRLPLSTVSDGAAGAFDRYVNLRPARRAEHFWSNRGLAA